MFNKKIKKLEHRIEELEEAVKFNYYYDCCSECRSGHWRKIPIIKVIQDILSYIGMTYEYEHSSYSEEKDKLITTQKPKKKNMRK